MQQIDNRDNIKETHLFSKIGTRNEKIIKIIELVNHKLLQQFHEQEIQMQRILANEKPQIALNIEDFCHEQENLIITYDCSDCQNIYNYKNGKTNEQKLDLFSQILGICVVLEKLGFIHNNIKPSNLLVCGGKVLLTDFGSPRTFDKNFREQFTEQKKQQWQLNTQFYQCEEYLQILNENRDTEISEDFEVLQNDKQFLLWSDKWSLGIIGLHIFINEPSNKKPYGLNPQILVEQLQNLENQGLKAVSDALNSLLIEKANPLTVYENFKTNNVLSQQSMVFFKETTEFNPEIILQRLQPQVQQFQIYQSKKDFLLMSKQILQIQNPYLETQENEENLYLDNQSKRNCENILHQIFQTLIGQNYWLKTFLDAQESLKLQHTLTFNQIKQLTENECTLYKQKLEELLQNKEEQYQSQRIQHRKQLMLNDIRKAKGCIFMAECRYRALLTLSQRIQDPEQEIIYFLTIAELESLIKNLNLNLLKSYLKLLKQLQQNQLELNTESIKYLSIEDLQYWNSHVKSEYLKQDIQYKMEQQRKLGIEQFCFYESLYARNLYEKFIINGDLSYKLNEKNFNLLYPQLKMSYVKRLFEKGQTNLDNNVKNALHEIHKPIQYNLNENGDIMYSISLPQGWESRSNILFRQKITPSILLPLGCRNLLAEFNSNDKIANYFGFHLEQQPHGIGLKFINSDFIIYGVFHFGQIYHGYSFQYQENKIMVYKGYFLNEKKHEGCLDIYELPSRRCWSNSSERYIDNPKYTYKGEFSNDLYHGQGKMYDSPNSYYEGKYHQGRRIGKHARYVNGQLIPETVCCQIT